MFSPVHHLCSLADGWLSPDVEWISPACVTGAAGIVVGRRWRNPSGFLDAGQLFVPGSGG
jgi:hypothetical protein